VERTESVLLRSPFVLSGEYLTMTTPFLAYPPIGHHGVIGDRRTAALVAADGTIDWLCLPCYDGDPIFGCLLDAERGGYWRVGPADPIVGQQRYRPESRVLVTTWHSATWELELTDVMAWAWDERDEAHGGESTRLLIRHLRCLQGEVRTVSDFQPRLNFGEAPPIVAMPDGLTVGLGELVGRFWTSRSGDDVDGRVMIDLRAGEEVWFIVVVADQAEEQRWTVERAALAVEETDRYWREWTIGLDHQELGGEQMRQSAATLHLLSFAPTGSPVAAPTTSLPERVGGDRNWDYRYSWVRDASLSISMLSRVGQLVSSRRYLDCLATYRSSTDSPLQIVYGIDGELDVPERKRSDLAGYRGSLPVRFGNRACGQRQLDSLGFFIDAALTYLEHDGEWTDRHWQMIKASADYTVANWQKTESGIWESLDEQHYLSGKVMSWVALDRAVKIAARTGRQNETDGWRAEMPRIHADVMERGWREERGTFCQHYDTDRLDAAALLIPIMGFLPIDHPRVTATIQRIVDELTIDGFVHRYQPKDDEHDWKIGEFEGAFLPCTFWLATVHALAGRIDDAEEVLHAVEMVAGDLGLFAEEVDVRDRTFLGNLPLVFAHAEYIRALLTIAVAKGSDVSVAAGPVPAGGP
jgi:GH15 family glucan-1,4-alpha-glucosidase